MTTSLDEKINELLLVLKSKRETLELHQSRSKSSWRTNCSFLLNDSHINLQTVRTSGIVSMVSYLLQQREAEKKACELLNIEFRDKIHNYSYDAWLEDCQKRASYLHIREQENQLNALESKLNQLVSPDKRRELELELLAKSITSLKI